MIAWVQFFASLLIAIVIHELGHMLVALACGVKVKTFSIGFGKPFFKFKFKDINFQFTPILLGGYISLVGEYDKVPNGFLAQRYLKKLAIVVAGVSVNALLAFVCYLINYQSIKIGFMIDCQLIIAGFVKDYDFFLPYLIKYSPNFFLLQLGVINIFCAIANLLPIPPLDGGFIWLLWLEKRVKNYGHFLRRITRIGMIGLYILQALIVWYAFN